MRKPKPEDQELKLRVKQARNKLIEIGADKSAIYYFKKKYPSHDKDEESRTRLDNLWYTKISDEAFTKELEAFVKFKQVEFE